MGSFAASFSYLKGIYSISGTKSFTGAIARGNSQTAAWEGWGGCCECHGGCFGFTHCPDFTCSIRLYFVQLP